MSQPAKPPSNTIQSAIIPSAIDTTTACNREISLDNARANCIACPV